MEHVEVLLDALRKAFRYGETHWQQADSEYARDHRKAGETMDKFRAWADETAAAIAPLSAPPPPAEAQPVAWRATVEGLRKFVTDATFRRFSPEIQRFYEPYKCGCCRAASPSAPVGMEVASLPALWRQREDNGEERTEFDKGYEQASDECAEALERALAAQQPAAVDGAMVWKPINVLPASDDLFCFARGDTVDGPRPPQYGGYDAEEWDWFAPAEAPPFSAEMDALAAQQGGPQE